MNRWGVCTVFALVATLAASSLSYAAQISLWPGAQISEIYDDNFHFTPISRKGDWVTTETLSGTVEAEAPHRSFFLTYQTLLIEVAHDAGADSFGKNHFVGLRDIEHLSANTDLYISDSFLVGSAVGGGFLTGANGPITAQLSESLLYKSTAISNNFSLDLISKWSEALTWSANLHQYLFVNSSNSNSGTTSMYSYGQGGAAAADYRIAGRLTAGLGYQFDDFRFSNGSLPTSDSNWPQVRMGWGANTPFIVTAQAGPIIFNSSSGTVGTVSSSSSGTTGTQSVSSKVKVDFGFVLNATYAARRWSIQASAAQIPGLSAGLAGAAIDRTFGLTGQYRFTRRMTGFVNSGYLDISGAGSYSRVITYTGGVAYEVNPAISLTGQYLGYRALLGGVSASSLVAAPGREAVANFFMFGVVLTPRPFKWSL